MVISNLKINFHYKISCRGQAKAAKCKATKNGFVVLEL